MTADQFIEFLHQRGASAILRTDLSDAVMPAMEAAIRAGFRICEFTLTVPDAFEHIAAFAQREGIVVGAGTVLTVEEARRAVEAGARFLVSPVVDEAVIEEASRLGVAMMPGTHTPTEMLRAHRAGAPLQKLFPAPPDGPDYVRACLGPLPFLRIVPTSGVRLDNAADFLSAGAFALGFVRSLFEPEDLAGGAFDRIEERARAIVGRVRQHADVRRNQPA